MLPVMDPFLELPDLPQNTVMLSYLRGQASPPAGPNDWLLGSWQLHAHLDLFRTGWLFGSMTCRPMRRPATAILLRSGSDHTAPR
jgi:hypothetical protein